MSEERKWPIEHPDRIQLYSLATPNGQKVSIALEELGLPYEPHKVNIMENDQFTDEFKAACPNSKIPAIVDPDGPDGKPLAIFESGAILLHLAEKTGKLIPTDARKRSECLQWLFFKWLVWGRCLASWAISTSLPKSVCRIRLSVIPTKFGVCWASWKPSLTGSRIWLARNTRLPTFVLFLGLVAWTGATGHATISSLMQTFPTLSPGINAVPRNLPLSVGLRYVDSIKPSS